MARPAKFTSEEILDHAGMLVSAEGPQHATVAAIAESLGAPSGSIYHRFESRDLIMARLWIRAVRRSQEDFLDAITDPDVRAAAHAATLHMPRWCRNHEVDARILLLHRREQLAAAWPDALGRELETLNEPLQTAVATFVARLPGRVTAKRREAVRMALFDAPYGVCRRHLLAGAPPPVAVDQLLIAVCDAVLFPAAAAAAVTKLNKPA